MKKIYDTIAGLAAGTFGLAYMGLMIGGFVGWAYWMWMAIHLGSFGMFVFGLLGPCAIPAGLIGLWSLLFGIPHWLA